MSTYLVKLTFGEFKFAADLSQASAPIFDIDDETGERTSTQWQTADARHREYDAAKLLLNSYGRDFWLDPDNHEIDEDGNETFDGLDEDEYLDSLIVSVDELAD